MDKLYTALTICPDITIRINYSRESVNVFKTVVWVVENWFSILNAPVMSGPSLDTHIPFTVKQENNFLTKSILVNRSKNYFLSDSILNAWPVRCKIKSDEKITYCFCSSLLFTFSF